MRKSIFALALLAGCAAGPTVEQIAERMAATCDAYGFQRGTPDFAYCLQAQYIARQQQRAAQLGALQSFGQALQQQSLQQRAMTPQPRQPITCNTVGGVTRCW